MPVEIRELVIQAKLLEDEPGNGAPVLQQASAMPDDSDLHDRSDPADDPEWMEKVVEQCMLRLKEWLTEKSMR